MQTGCGGDCCLGVAKGMAGPENGGVTLSAASGAGQDFCQGRPVGKALDARDFFENALVLEQGGERSRKRIVAE